MFDGRMGWDDVSCVTEAMMALRPIGWVVSIVPQDPLGGGISILLDLLLTRHRLNFPVRTVEN